jgi:hypothetical protein
MNQAVLSAGNAWVRLWSNGIWAVITVVGFLVFIRNYGGLGLATVLCVAQALHLLVQFVICRRKMA